MYAPRRCWFAGAAAVLSLFAAAAAGARAPPPCPQGVDAVASMPLAPASAPASCSLRMSHGYPKPDPACTPGATNPTVTLKVLQSGQFRTRCERNRASATKEKNATYAHYRITRPQNNRGQNQTCELDHLVSLELGGADTVDNIWPQCGPEGVSLDERYFKIKDGVENYLAATVRSGDMRLTDAQRGIATDWTQYIDLARAYWKNHAEHPRGRDY